MTTILLVEDNPGDARLIVELLRDKSDLANDYTIIQVERISDAVKALADNQAIDLVLSDISLPDSRGIDTLKTLNAAASQIPVIFMTGTNDEALAVTAMEQGAQDYLVKGHIDSDLLGRAVRYAVQRKKFQNEMSRVRESDKLNQQRIKLLADQKRQLIRLNKSKDEFIAIASHQLRTPATAVKQYVGMIVEGMAGEVEASLLMLLNRAYESNERQLIVINELLKTARLDASKLQLELLPTSLNQLVTDCVEQLRPISDARNQKLYFTATADNTVMADSDELRLALTNLLENASKYTPDSRNITVTTGADKGKAWVAVSDEGVGIAPEYQAQIFDKFSRIDNELSDTVQGTGLGLYWVKRIARLHKGTVRVESDLGKGSTFTISLPSHLVTT